jgi:hypothetical protein
LGRCVPFGILFSSLAKAGRPKPRERNGSCDVRWLCFCWLLLVVVGCSRRFEQDLAQSESPALLSCQQTPQHATTNLLVANTSSSLLFATAASQLFPLPSFLLRESY